MKTCRFFNIEWQDGQWGEDDRQITGCDFPPIPNEISAYNFADDFDPSKDGFQWLYDELGFWPTKFKFAVEPYNEKESKIVLAED